MMKMNAIRGVILSMISMTLMNSCLSQATTPQSPPAVVWTEPYYRFNKVLGVGTMLVTTGGDTSGLKPGYPALKYIIDDKHWWYWDGESWKVIGSGGGSNPEVDPVFTASGANGIVTLDKTHWNLAYNKRPVSVAFTGTTTKTLTLTLGDASTIIGTFTDNDAGGGVTSFNSRTGAVVPTSGDYTTSLVAEGSNLYYTTARQNTDFDTRLALKTTSNLTEGSNLYWTDARFDTRFDPRFDTRFDVRLALKTTSNLTEGSNLYWTNARFDTRFDTRLATKTTSDLTEGSRLYWTQVRFDTAFSVKTTSDLAEGTNLYWTNARGDARIALARGAANGVASLDGSSKVPIDQLPAGAQTYKGTWNATTNAPTLIDGTGDAGDTYRVTVGGTRNLGSGSIVWVAGDDAIYNGTIWQRNPSSTIVASVNGQTGAVVLDADDIAEGSTNLYFSGKTTTDLPEGAGLYFTNARARGAISVSGSLAYNSATGDISYTTPSIPAQFNPIAGTGMTITGTYPNMTFAAAGAGVSSFNTRTGAVVPATNDYTFAQIGSKPTTLGGYGITDASISTHTHTFASLTSKPTTLLGYGITDAAAISHTHTFASLTSIPTTIGGYGITNAYNKTEVDSIVALGTGLSDCGVINVSAINANGFSWVITDPTNSPTLLLNQQFGIADGSTTGRVGFNGSDFLTTSGIARLNYASGQSGSASAKGYIIPTDWSRFNSKADSITGGATSIASSNLSPNKVLISNGAGKVIVSRIDTQHIGFLGLARSDIQQQIDNISVAAGPLAITIQPANYTLVIGDAQGVIRMTQTTAVNLTVPLNGTVAFPIGTQVTVVQDNLGKVTFVPVSGVTLNSSNGLRTRARYSTVTLIKTGANIWLVTGDLTP